MKYRFILPFLLFVCILVGLPGDALAHSSLAQAQPGPDAVLPQPPTQIVLVFTRPVKVKPDTVILYDEQGAIASPSEARVDPQDPTRVIAPIRFLLDGVYTVSWEVTADDGHPISDSYSFTVGQARPWVKPYRPGARADAQRPPLDILIGYWLATGGLMLLTGLGLTQRLIVGGDGDAPFVRWLRLIVVGASAGTALVLWGRGEWPIGVGLLVILVLIAMLLPRWGRRWWTAALGGAVGLCLLALDGHAIALPSPVLGVLLDWVHLLAAGVWMGGVVQFAFLIPPQDRLGWLVQRFTPLAAVSLAVLAGTGLYPALAQIPSLDALLETGYGKTLILKVGLILPLLILGGMNLLVLGPELRRGLKVGRMFKRLVTGEVVLMGAILGAAIFLSNQAPPRMGQAAIDLAPKELNVGIHSETHTFLFRMQPLSPGVRSLMLTVRPHEGVIGADTSATLEVTKEGQVYNEPPLVGQFLGEDRFRFDQINLSSPGLWQFRVEFTRPGYQPEWVTLPFDLPSL